MEWLDVPESTVLPTLPASAVLPADPEEKPTQQDSAPEGEPALTPKKKKVKKPRQKKQETSPEEPLTEAALPAADEVLPEAQKQNDTDIPAAFLTAPDPFISPKEM